MKRLISMNIKFLKVVTKFRKKSFHLAVGCPFGGINSISKKK